jgi:hypothetical protein
MSHLNGHTNWSPQSAGNAKTKTSPRPVLEPGASTELRDRLVAQVAEIGSADEAALWAYCNMRAKNGLTTADARQVEEAFKGKLAGFAGPQERLSSEGRDVLPRAGSVIHKPAESQGETTASNPRPAAPSLTSVDAKPSDRPLRSKATARRSKSADSRDRGTTVARQM